MATHKTSSERMAEVVARARRRWQTQSRNPEPVAVLAPPRPAAFTVALSRQAGANGSGIGRLVGERLGWPVYDRELVEQIAEEMGLRTMLLEGVDEKRMSWLRELAESFALGQSLSESGYVRHLVETVLTLAMHGECILIGRGASVIAPAETTLRVRVIASLADRIATAQKRLSLSAEQARQWVEKTDRDRTNFVKDHFHKDPNEPCHHDVVLNSSRFSVEDSADLVIEALHRMQARVSKDAQREVLVGAGASG